MVRLYMISLYMVRLYVIRLYMVSLYMVSLLAPLLLDEFFFLYFPEMYCKSHDLPKSLLMLELIGLRSSLVSHKLDVLVVNWCHQEKEKGHEQWLMARQSLG